MRNVIGAAMWVRFDYARPIRSAAGRAGGVLYPGELKRRERVAHGDGCYGPAAG